MLNFHYKERYNIYDLREIVKILRSPGGCPWDTEQTHESIRRNILEEAYEVAEAIDDKNTEHLCEELGDVLLHVLFHSRIEEESGGFDFDDVANAVCKKLIFRHPHVFGDVAVKDSDEVLKNWDEIKRVEKEHQTVTDTLNSVARSLPALWRAEKIQSKASKIGFDWPDIDGALNKLEEEIGELRQAVKDGKNAPEELGDVLFSAVNVARFLETDPEEALGASCEKFLSRFSYIEQEALKSGRELSKMSLEEMDELYNRSKSL